MKTDRELLELAAKAAGYKVVTYCEIRGVLLDGSGRWFNPLTNGDDALQLAVKLELAVNITTEATFVNNKAGGEVAHRVREQHKDSNPMAATFRAIVRLAAAVGENPTKRINALFLQARHRREWTMERVARATGLSITVVNNAETRTPTRLHTVLALCRIYDIPLDTMAQLYWSEVNHEHNHHPAGAVHRPGRVAGPPTAQS